MIKVAPSILSADFANMGRDVQRLAGWGADAVHFDVMDGSFVPAITFGTAMCKAVRPYTELPLDVHIMVEHPETYIGPFREAGADCLTFHVEADRHSHRTLQRIRAAGMKAGVALNPATPVCMVEEVLPECDLVLVMSVNPGAGGQKFIPGALQKIERLACLAREHGFAYEIEVDGGINAETAVLAVRAGATMLVSGSSVFQAEDPAALIAQMHALDKKIN